MNTNKNYETLKLTFDWYKEDKEKDILNSKDKHKSDINEMIKEMQHLQHKLEGS